MSAGSSHSALMVDRDMARLAPSFAQAVRAALAECNAKETSLDAILYEGYRSPALQALYYQRGRTVRPPEEPVTNAPTNLHSWHGYGLAVDIVHRKGFWAPPEGEAWFHQVAAIFRRHDCNWGGDWKRPDLAHFQWAACPASPSDAAREFVRMRGLLAVWDHFGARRPAPAGDAAA